MVGVEWVVLQRATATIIWPMRRAIPWAVHPAFLSYFWTNPNNPLQQKGMVQEPCLWGFKGSSIMPRLGIAIFRTGRN